MVMEVGIFGILLHGFLQGADGGIVGTLIVISPAKGVSGAGDVWQAPSARLCERDSDVDVAAVVEHQICKVVRGKRIIRLHLQCLLVKLFSMLPIAPPLQQTGKRDIEGYFPR